MPRDALLSGTLGFIPGILFAVYSGVERVPSGEKAEREIPSDEEMAETEPAMLDALRTARPQARGRTCSKD